ncbi:MAG: O-antigen ligase family protein [Geminicoccaceae bacterium]|nr:O-antigen ligase family protein [Geminicoccaceae bacterium]
MVLLVVPWPLGSVGSGPSWFLVFAAWTLLVLRAFGLLLRADGRVPLPRPVAVAAGLGVAVLLWATVQTLPGPGSEWAHPIWRDLPEEPTPAHTPSLDPDATRAALARLFAYVALGVLAYLAARRRARAERLATIAIAATALQAAFGLLRTALGLETIFGVDLGLERTNGSFVNPNHFAAYVNLGLVTVAVLLLEDFRRHADAPRFSAALARGVRLLFEKRFLLAAVFALLAMASFASGSRGGFAALVLTLAIALPIQLGAGRALFAVALVLVAFAAVLIATAGTPTLERLDSLLPASEFHPEAGGRLAIFALALSAWRERPWLGHGYGTWPAVFHLFRDERFPIVVFDYAHNTWLELLVELGAPAAVALLVALVLLSACSLRGYERGREPLPMVGFAVGSYLALHGLVDFPAQIPAIAATFAVLFGLGVGRAAAILARSGRDRASPE